MSILNLSTIINSIDKNVITYNGSVLPIGNNKNIVAYRATQKPTEVGVKKKHLPPYPYQQMNGSLWYNARNYIGLAVIDMSKSRPKVISASKYVHTIHPRLTNQELYDNLTESYPDVNFKSLLAGPEDPRLYYKEVQKDDMKTERKIYMNYNQSFINPLGGCEGLCVSMFEIEIKLSKLNIKIYPERGKKLICEKVDDENGHIKKLFNTTNQNTIKNWSYSPGFFIDSYKDSAFLYNLKKHNDPSECVKSKYNSVMIPFIQDDWGVALTTPTVKYEEKLYGVAHIRIKWSAVSSNLNLCSDELKNIIKKADVHHDDFYFMSVYKIENNIWSMARPILATGKSSNKYYSYNVNFPCGFFISNKKYNITFGLGDCILMHLKDKINNLTFSRTKFTYGDLKVFNIEDKMLRKKYINSCICKYEKLNNYILPKYIRLFDLGGGGLRSRVYNSISKKMSNEINFGRDSTGLTPDKIIRKFDNDGKYKIDINNEYLNGWGFAFSLAGIDKLWVEYLSKTMVNKLPSCIKRKFNLINTDKIISIKDSESHLFGSFHKLEENSFDINSNNILNIAIGTGINISFSQKGKIKSYNTCTSQIDKQKKKYFWDITLNHNGKNTLIRDALIDPTLTRTQLYKIIGVFLGFLDNDINMSCLWPTDWEIPTIITITGGGSNILYNKIPQGFLDIPRKYLDHSETWGKLVEIFVFPDKELPYMGLLWKFIRETCHTPT